MPLTEDEFRTLVVERAADPAPPVDRLASVHRRIRRRRRRRDTVAGALVAAALVATAVGLPHLRSPERSGVAAPAPASTILAQYASGGRLLASGVLSSPAMGQVSFQFTPTDWHLQVQLDCADGWPQDAWSAVRVNGHPLMEGGCGAAMSGPFGREQAFWADAGVRLGQPSTVTLTLVAPLAGAGQAPSPLPAAQRPTGRLATGVYQRVPLSDYPLPPRPATLQPLPRVSGPGALDSRVVGATGTFTVRATVGATEIRTTAVAPGALRLLVNGKPIDEHDSWRWDVVAGAATTLSQDTLREAGLRVPEGATVTVTVEATRFAVPGWTLEVRSSQDR